VDIWEADAVQIVDWGNPQPFIDKRGRNRTKYQVTCTECLPTHPELAVRWLERDKARKVRFCTHCQRRFAGKRNYQHRLDALTTKGMSREDARKAIAHELIEYTRENQLARPSGPEQIVMGWLKDLNVPFQRQVIVFDDEGQNFIVDFEILRAGKPSIYVEVNSAYYHDMRPGRDAALRRLVTVIEVDSDRMKTDLEGERQSFMKSFLSEYSQMRP
jgi:hypothetical protein